MNSDKLADIWYLLINKPTLPIEIIAKRCNTSVEVVEKAAAIMGKHSNNLKR